MLTRILTSSFFHHSNQPGPLTNGLEYLQFWLSYQLSPSYSNCSIEKTDSLQYDATESQKKDFILELFSKN